VSTPPEPSTPNKPRKGKKRNASQSNITPQLLGRSGVAWKPTTPGELSFQINNQQTMTGFKLPGVPANRGAPGDKSRPSRPSSPTASLFSQQQSMLYPDSFTPRPKPTDAPPPFPILPFSPFNTPPPDRTPLYEEIDMREVSEVELEYKLRQVLHGIKSLGFSSVAQVHEMIYRHPFAGSMDIVQEVFTGWRTGLPRLISAIRSSQTHSEISKQVDKEAYNREVMESATAIMAGEFQAFTKRPDNRKRQGHGVKRTVAAGGNTPSFLSMKAKDITHEFITSDVLADCIQTFSGTKLDDDGNLVQGACYPLISRRFLSNYLVRFQTYGGS